ncbi:type IV secretion protein IcmC [Legionella sp. CNM-4043-24]|uniref:type IV secretion protein IcmC n=1 Tax=Legionella sp. CNM-4043-24 TaxID=3421646 RepID=UPI00403ABE43
MSAWYDQIANFEPLKNIATSLIPVQKLISGAAYILGLGFFIKAVLALKALGESRSMMSGGSHSMKEPLVYFLVASVLLYLPTAVSTVLMTAFGSSNILEYASSDSRNPAIQTLFGPDSTVGHSLSIVIQTIGLVAFVRGWILIARSASQGQQPGGVGKGLVHIFGGIVAMNIVLTLQIIDNTLYGPG